MMFKALYHDKHTGEEKEVTVYAIQFREDGLMDFVVYLNGRWHRCDSYYFTPKEALE